MKGSIDRFKDVSARVYVIVPALENYVPNSQKMGRREVVDGDVSGNGGMIGPVATALDSIRFRAF